MCLLSQLLSWIKRAKVRAVSRRAEATEADAIFVSLEKGTPELVTRATSVGLESDVGHSLASVARRLAGYAVDDPGFLGAALFACAGGEIRVLEGICNGEPVRAAAAATALIDQVLRTYASNASRAEKTREERGEAPPNEASADPTASDTEVEELREQLAELFHRRVPDDFPLPDLQPDVKRGVVETGAAMREQLGVGAGARAAARAALECNEAMTTLGCLLPGYGWDYSKGALHKTLLADLRKFSELLQRLASLRKIADELGRMEASEQTRRRTHGGGRESVVGVRVGGELSDVLPCELALLAEEETEDLFFQRYSERRLLCLELRGAELEHAMTDEHRGPVVACVDTSGSMQGAPEAVAKALILAVVRKLVPQRRAMHILMFGGPGNTSDLVVRPGRAGLEALLDFLRLGFHAGTDYDTPLRRALKLLETEKFAKADVLVVTDGLCRASQSVVEEVARAKAEANARVLSVVIGSDVAGVDDFSDSIWRLDPHSPAHGGLDLVRWRAADDGPMVL